MGPLIWLITITKVTLLTTPRRTTHEAPSRVSFEGFL